MVKMRKCKSFALDLMHFATNELDEIKDLPALKEHLKGCKKCRVKFAKLREVDVFSFLAKPRSAKYRKKMAVLIKRARRKAEVSRSSNKINHTKKSKKNNGCK